MRLLHLSARLALPLALAALLAACGSSAEPEGATSASDAPSAGASDAASTSGDPDAAASVGDETITLEEFEQEVADRTSDPQIAAQLEGDPTGAALQQLEIQVLNQLIITRLFEQGAEEEGVEIGDAEIADARAQTIEQIGGEEAFQQVIDQAGLTEEEIEQELRLIALQQGLTEALVPEVTDEEVQTFYEENQETQFGPTVTARHILVEESATARDALARIEGGEDFAAVAAELSVDPSGQQGGDLGEIPRGQTVPEFEEAAYGAEVGELVGPVETEFGFHLIEVTERNEEGTSLEDAEEEIRTQLTGQQSQSAIGEFLAERGDSVEVNPRFGSWDPATGTVVPAEPLGPVQPPAGGAPGAPGAPPGAPGAPGAPGGPGAPQQAPQGAPQQQAPPAPGTGSAPATESAS